MKQWKTKDLLFSLANENRPNVANAIRRREYSDRNEMDWKKWWEGEGGVGSGGGNNHHHQLPFMNVYIFNLKTLTVVYIV